MGQQRPECVAAAFQKGQIPSGPSLAHAKSFPSSTCYHGKPLQDTSPIPRTCSSFSSICSTACVVLRVVKQEACSKGFATIYIMSGSRLENIVRAMSESA